MKRIQVFLLSVLVLGIGSVRAGIVDPPFVMDQFPSQLDATLRLLPAWTGDPNPIDIDMILFGPTKINRELNAMPGADGLGGPDTVDAEIVDINLMGTAPTPIGNTNVEIRAGEGNGFFAGLKRSGGQIQETPGNFNLLLDVFPADSIFDVFFDMWIDLDMDGTVDVGEVLRNFDAAVRMRNGVLSQLPPAALIDVYTGEEQVVDMNDPNIGMFNATDFLPGPLNMFVVNADGSQGPLHAQLLSEVHTPLPEPASALVWSLLCASIGITVGWSRRRRSRRFD